MNPIIIVPYRNRSAHLAQFLSHMKIYYAIVPICIIEQNDNKPFNRAKLLNIGYLENKGFSDYIFHDVDMLPINVNYTIKRLRPIVQLASSNIQLFDYLGGVTRFTWAAFERSGGYNNEYYHRAEDNEMMFNLKRLQMNVIRKPGQYKILDHERQGPEFDPALWTKAMLQRKVQNQLACCNYNIQHINKFGSIKQITVAI